MAAVWYHPAYSRTHIYDGPAWPLLPREVHQLVIGPLEEADGSFAKVRGDVELVTPLVGDLRLAGLEAQQRLPIRSMGGVVSIQEKLSKISSS